jgi:hypothetical protein
MYNRIKILFLSPEDRDKGYDVLLLSKEHFTFKTKQASKFDRDPFKVQLIDIFVVTEKQIEMLEQAKIKFRYM